MDQTVFVDGGILLVILISAILAYSRGFVREVLSIGGWVIAAVVAYVFTPSAEPLVREIPYLNDVLQENCIWSHAATAAVVFVIALVIVSIFTPLFSGMVQRSALSALDRGLGFLFGLLRGLVLVVIALVLYEIILPEGERPAYVEQSQSRAMLAGLVDSANNMRPTEVPAWLENRFSDFISVCETSGNG